MVRPRILVLDDEKPSESLLGVGNNVRLALLMRLGDVSSDVPFAGDVEDDVVKILPSRSR